MKLIAWNTTTCPAALGDSTPSCPSVSWFWIALALVGLAGLARRKGKVA